MICLFVLSCSELHYMYMCVVAEAVRRNYATAKASVAETEGQVKEWLKFAKSREKSHQSAAKR